MWIISCIWHPSTIYISIVTIIIPTNIADITSPNGTTIKSWRKYIIFRLVRPKKEKEGNPSGHPLKSLQGRDSSLSGRKLLFLALCGNCLANFSLYLFCKLRVVEKKLSYSLTALAYLALAVAEPAAALLYDAHVYGKIEDF